MIGDLDVLVEVSFNDTPYSSDLDDLAWTDITPYVEGDAPLSITRGRQDELGEVQPSQCQVTLDNSDGRFTPENTGSPYYPQVKRGRPLRVRVVYPASQPHNLLDVQNAGSLEDGTTDGWAVSPVAGYTLGSYSNSTTRAVDGTRSLLVTWNGGVDPGIAYAVATYLTLGRTYTVSAYVWVPTGSPDVFLRDFYSGTTSASTSLKDQWVRLSFQVTLTTLDRLSLAVVANSTTSGEQVWVDGAQVSMSDELMDYSSDPQPVYDRFMGYVNEWPVQWGQGTDDTATTTIVATSRMARLGSAAEFQSIVEEEILNDEGTGLGGPKLYYPLGEPDGSTSATNRTKYSDQPQLTTQQAGSGGTLEFGQGTGPGTDGLTAPLFTRASAGNGKYLQVQTVNTFHPTNSLEKTLFGRAWDVGFVAFVATSVVADQTVVLIDNDPSGAFLMLGIDSTGKPFSAVRKGTGAITVVTGPASVADGEVHALAFYAQATESPDELTLSLIVDGSITTGSAVPWSIDLFDRAFSMTRVGVGGPSLGGEGDVFDGTIAHVAVFDSPTTTTLIRYGEAGLTGFADERSDERIERYARLAGIENSTGVQVDELDLETGQLTTTAHTNTNGQTPLTLMQSVVASEAAGGVLFDARNGTLTFHARDHRYGATSEFTLDVSAQEVTDLAPRLDDQQLTNEASVSRPNGPTVRAVDRDSVSDYGAYKYSREVLTTSDDEIVDHANHIVQRNKDPFVRIPNVGVDVPNLPDARISEVLTADIGTRFTLTGLPSQAPWSETELFVEGTTEEVTATGYSLGFYTSPASLSNVWVLDSATDSQLDETTLLAL